MGRNRITATNNKIFIYHHQQPRELFEIKSSELVKIFIPDSISSGYGYSSIASFGLSAFFIFDSQWINKDKS